MRTLYWEHNKLIIIDQTKLPLYLEQIICEDYKRVIVAIKRLEVRGAPAIGAAAAYGLLLGARSLQKQPTYINFCHKLKIIKKEIEAARPTAVNLEWALNKMISALSSEKNINAAILTLQKTADEIFSQDVQSNELIGTYGASLLSKNSHIITHCNAGALATCGIGTALGVIRIAHKQGKISMVYADETRPLLQGARLTAYELSQDNIPVTLITDSMAAWVMKNKNINAVIVGADRIAANGDTANKIGTYSLAISAKTHNIPFYIAAPLSTFDFDIESGDDIPIEERNPNEIFYIQDRRIAPNNINAFNPAFDVTPAYLINAIITEYGIIHRPNKEIMLEFINKLKIQGVL